MPTRDQSRLLVMLLYKMPDRKHLQEGRFILPHSLAVWFITVGKVCSRVLRYLVTPPKSGRKGRSCPVGRKQSMPHPGTLLSTEF